jgi:hypothetical protein
LQTTIGDESNEQIRLSINIFRRAVFNGCRRRLQVAGNPPYTLEQSVVASGGDTSAGSQFSTTGTIGQSLTNASGNSPYSIKSGFFTAVALAPTAATVTIGGRVLTYDGRGIRNVILTMTDSSGANRTARTTAFGYYRFSDVPAARLISSRHAPNALPSRRRHRF